MYLTAAELAKLIKEHPECKGHISLDEKKLEGEIISALVEVREKEASICALETIRDIQDEDRVYKDRNLFMGVILAHHFSHYKDKDDVRGLLKSAFEIYDAIIILREMIDQPNALTLILNKPSTQKIADGGNIFVARSKIILSQIINILGMEDWNLPQVMVLESWVRRSKDLRFLKRRFNLAASARDFEFDGEYFKWEDNEDLTFFDELLKGRIEAAKKAAQKAKAEQKSSAVAAPASAPPNPTLSPAEGQSPTRSERSGSDSSASSHASGTSSDSETTQSDSDKETPHTPTKAHRSSSADSVNEKEGAASPTVTQPAPGIPAKSAKKDNFQEAEVDSLVLDATPKKSAKKKRTAAILDSTKSGNALRKAEKREKAEMAKKNKEAKELAEAQQQQGQSQTETARETTSETNALPGTAKEPKGDAIVTNGQAAEQQAIPAEIGALKIVEVPAIVVEPSTLAEAPKADIEKSEVQGYASKRKANITAYGAIAKARWDSVEAEIERHKEAIRLSEEVRKAEEELDAKRKAIEAEQKAQKAQKLARAEKAKELSRNKHQVIELLDRINKIKKCAAFKVTERGLHLLFNAAKIDEIKKTFADERDYEAKIQERLTGLKKAKDELETFLKNKFENSTFEQALKKLVKEITSRETEVREDSAINPDLDRRVNDFLQYVKDNIAIDKMEAIAKTSDEKAKEAELHLEARKPELTKACHTAKLAAYKGFLSSSFDALKEHHKNKTFFFESDRDYFVEVSRLAINRKLAKTPAMSVADAAKEHVKENATWLERNWKKLCIVFGLGALFYPFVKIEKKAAAIAAEIEIEKALQEADKISADKIESGCKTLLAKLPKADLQVLQPQISRFQAVLKTEDEKLENRMTLLQRFKQFVGIKDAKASKTVGATSVSPKKVKTMVTPASPEQEDISTAEKTAQQSALASMGGKPSVDSQMSVTDEYAHLKGATEKLRVEAADALAVVIAPPLLAPQVTSPTKPGELPGVVDGEIAISSKVPHVVPISTPAPAA